MFKAALKTLYYIAPAPSFVDDLESEDEKKKFIIAFRELSKVLLKLQTFTEFEFSEDKLGIGEQKYQDFKSKYLLIYDDLKITDYYNGLAIITNNVQDDEKGYLTDTCLTAQDKYKVYLDYFRIAY